MPTLTSLKTVGHATPRIDAVERVTGKATYTATSISPECSMRACCAARMRTRNIRKIDVSKALALPGVKSVMTHENCTVVWGAGSIAGGRQYVDEIKKITAQRRYAFNNPVRFVGEPVAAVAATDRHTAEEALRLITVEYEVLPFVLDQEEALARKASRSGPTAIFRSMRRTKPNRSLPARQHRGRLPHRRPRLRRPLHHHLRAQRADGAARLRRAAGKATSSRVYTPTGASPIAAPTWRAIWASRRKSARHLPVHGRQLRQQEPESGCRSDRRDAGQGSRRAGEAGAFAQRRFHRRARPLADHSILQGWREQRRHAPGASVARLQRHGAVPQEFGRQSAGVELYQCPNVESTVYPVYTNRTVSGNFRAPEFPQGFFGIQSMMDDVAYKMNMDPVDFVLKNMTRKSNDEVPYSNYTLEECIRRGAEAFEWKKRWHAPGSDPGPIKRGAGMAFMAIRSPLGHSSAVIRLDSKGRYTVFVGVTDVGAGAKTTMGMIAAEALDVPLSQVDVVWGDTDRCPYSVGESGSRTTDMTGYAVIEAARDLKRQIAEKGLPKGENALIASASPNPTVGGQGAQLVWRALRGSRSGYGTRPRSGSQIYCGARLRPHHESADGHQPDQRRRDAGHRHGAARGSALRPAQRTASDAGYYGARVMTHLDAPEIEVIFIESDDGYGPFGAKSIGEAGIVHAVAAVGNAIFNAIGRRMKDLPITRDKILGALA